MQNQGALSQDSNKPLSQGVRDQVDSLKQRLYSIQSFLLTQTVENTKELMDKITALLRLIDEAMREGSDGYSSVKKDASAYVGALSRYIAQIEIQAKELTQPKKTSRRKGFSPKIESTKPKRTTKRK